MPRTTVTPTDEPAVLVNGVLLSRGQSMALRMAVSSALERMNEPNVLGEDEHGRAMAKAYRDHLLAIDRLL